MRGQVNDDQWRRVDRRVANGRVRKRVEFDATIALVAILSLAIVTTGPIRCDLGDGDKICQEADSQRRSDHRHENPEAKNQQYRQKTLHLKGVLGVEYRYVKVMFRLRKD